MALAEETQDQEVMALQVQDHQEPVSASNGALSFKLKIPKSENMVEDHHLAAIARLPCSTTDLLRTCSECGKQFSSGKALGGHKRACLQKKISQKLIVKKVDREETSSELKNSGLNLNCYVCHQSFRSLKSLYGHMRKHPEREWRGILPPQAQATGINITNYSSTIDNEDNDDDHKRRDDDSFHGAGSTMYLVESLKGWPVKARRGHRVSTSTSVSDEDESKAMQQAVNDLLLLAKTTMSKKGGALDHGSSAGSGYGVLKIKERRMSDADQDGIKKREILRSFSVEKEKGKTAALKENSDTDYEDDSELETAWRTKHHKKKRRRLTELDDMEGVNEEAATIQTYSCPICDKVFTKHQALGGHVASHNKNKNNNMNSNVKESSASVAVSAASEDGNCEDANNNINNNTSSKVVENERQVGSEETSELSRVAAAAGEEHQCNICSKTFPTGQALGGHKRCHWAGPAEAFSSSSQVTTSAGEVTQTARRVVFDIDLNDTPPEYYQFYGAAR